MFPSPYGTSSHTSTAEAIETLPVLTSVRASSSYEALHILPKTVYTEYTSCKVNACVDLNKSSDGHNTFVQDIPCIPL